MSGCPAKRVIGIGVLVAITALLIPSSVSCSKPPRPTATFSISYVSGELLVLEEYIAGTAPLKVQFNDQSTGEITSWRWNFGDGTVIGPGTGVEYQKPIHEYITPNTGYIVTLTVRGPGGTDAKEEPGIVTVFRCSEAAVVELTQATKAIQNCLGAAGRTVLDLYTAAWDGSRNKVMAGGLDAADYLGVWTDFKATYTVEQDGSIASGTDVSWGCVRWDPSGLLGRPGWVAK